MGRASRRRRAARDTAPRRLPEVVPVSRALLREEAWRGLQQLATLDAERSLTERQIHELVTQLAAVGVSWAEIGRTLGMTRQGARQRYASQAAATRVVVSTDTSV